MVILQLVSNPSATIRHTYTQDATDSSASVTPLQNTEVGSHPMNRLSVASVRWRGESDASGSCQLGFRVAYQPMDDLGEHSLRLPGHREGRKEAPVLSDQCLRMLAPGRVHVSHTQRLPKRRREPGLWRCPSYVTGEGVGRQTPDIRMIAVSAQRQYSCGQAALRNRIKEPQTGSPWLLPRLG